jgi:SAM-dependent MidA family methyltransferase
MSVEWRRIDLPDRSDDGSGTADLVLANEYLDALPLHRVLQSDGLHEVYVTWIDGWFAEVVATPSTPALAAHLARDGVVLHEGQRAEICLGLPEWVNAVTSALSEDGAVLVIDYGHDAVELYGPRRMAGSLLTYRGHVVSDDPFAAIGHTDITAHVDITALEQCALEGGLELVGTTTQGPFLTSLGLGQLLADLGREPDVEPNDYLEARAAVGRLLDPRHLGAFRVLAFARPRADGSVPALPGFELAP